MIFSIQPNSKQNKYPQVLQLSTDNNVNKICEQNFKSLRGFFLIVLFSVENGNVNCAPHLVRKLRAKLQMRCRCVRAQGVILFCVCACVGGAEFFATIRES